ncbi:MAG TPA: hypothetical protein VGI55_11470 [Solirubrobacteraceae bacterium]
MHSRRNHVLPTPPRLVGAILVAAIGGIHLYLWFDYFHRVHVIGVLFLANAGAGALIALWLLTSDGVIALVAGAGFAATTLAGFLISTQWGLFGFHERFSGTWQSTAGLVELVTIILLGTLAAQSLLRPVHGIAEGPQAAPPH